MPEPTTQPAPAMPQLENPNMLVGALASRLRQTLSPNGPTAGVVLEWLQTQKPEVIRQAIIATQPQGWSVAIEPLVKSMTDEQVVGFLAAMMAVFVQTLPAPNA